MKNETVGKPIKVFVSLWSEMYSLLCDGKKKKTVIDNKNSVIHRNLCHAAYRDVLLSQEGTIALLNLIQSYHHKVFNISCKKQALSSFDNKRCVLDD